MPKYYSPNLVQMPTCHGSLACDYDNERQRKGGGSGGNTAAMLIKEAEAERRREAAATTELPVKCRRKRNPKCSTDSFHNLSRFTSKKIKVIGSVSLAFGNLEEPFFVEELLQTTKKRPLS